MAVVKFGISVGTLCKEKHNMQLTIISLRVPFSGISLKTLKQLVAAFNGMNINTSLAYCVV